MLGFLRCFNYFSTKGGMNLNTNRTKKIALTGILEAIAVVGSLFSFPIFGSRAAPIQHMVNLIAAVLLGPWYGVVAAFIASLLRNILSLGSILAFPGSMIGAWLAGVAYQKTQNLFLSSLGEIVGTGLLGGLAVWSSALLFLGETAGSITFYIYIRPFLSSTIVGTVIVTSAISILKRNKVLNLWEESESTNDD